MPYMVARMRIGIVGAGGVGGLIAGLLSRAGHDVAVVARGSMLQAVRDRGLRIDSPLGTFAARVEAVAAASELAPVDAMLVAVKAWQVPEVAASLAPALGRDGIVVPLQNGVDSADQCADALGDDRVFGGICHVLSWIAEPGAVKHVSAPPRVTLGAWRSPATPRLEALREALDGAGVPSRVASNFPAALWDKFLFIVGFAGVGAVARAGAAAIRTVPQTRNMLVGSFEEVYAVATAKGVALKPDTVAKALALIDVLPDDAIASLQRDIVAGRPSELDSLSGAVARIGAEVAVPVPIHQAIYAALLPQELAARRSS
jgi:2-dehydropantoate 2-reductase